MRHRVKKRHLGRDHDHKKALRRNLIKQLFEHERIKTTEAKAKFMRGEAEKLITVARNRGDAVRLLELAEDGEEETLARLVTKNAAARLVTLAKADDRFYEVDGKGRDRLEDETKAIVVHAQRLVGRKIQDRFIIDKLFHEIAPRYVNRPGGYTRILKLGPRKGDAADMVFLELVEETEE